MVTPGVGGIGTLTLASLTFTGSATVNVGVQNYAPSSLLQVNGNVATAGVNTVTFAFGGNLASINTGTYTLLSYTGTQLSDVSAFLVSGSTGARQSVNLAGATGAVNVVIGNAFPIWSGTDGSGWSTTDNWKLNTTGSATSFLAADTVVFDDASSQGSVTLSQNVNPSTSTFSGTTQAYTLSSAGGFGITSGNLVKSGPATLTVTTSNSFAGGTTLSAGTIRVGDDAALGTGGITVSGSTAGMAITSDGGTARTLANGLHLDGDVTLGNATDNGALTITGTVTFDGNSRTITTPSNVMLSGLVTNGGFTKAGAGVLTVTGSNDYAAGTTLSAGTLRVGNNAALGSGGVGLNSGALSSDSTSARTLTNAVTVGGDVTLGDAASTGALTLGAGGVSLGNGTRQVTTASDVTFAGAVTNGGLVKLGAGTLTLAAANSYSGGTTLSAGALALGNAGALGSGTLTVAGNAAIQTALTGTITNAVSIDPSVTGTFDAQSGSATWSGVIGGSGALAKAGAGTVVLTATSTYAGDTTISAGTLQIAGAGLLGGGSYAGAVTNSGTLAVATSANQTLSGGVSGVGGLTKAGAGTLTLSNGANSFSGGSTITGGTVSFSSGALGSSGTVALGGGTLRWATGNTQDISARLAVVNATTSTIDIGTNDVSFAGTFGGGASGGLVKAGVGTLTVTGTGTYTGLTTISTGTLRLGNGGTTGGLATSGTITIASGASLAFNRSNTITQGTDLANVISGAGGIVVLGGTASLSNANTYTGNVLVSAGTLLLSNGGGNGGTTTGLGANTVGKTLTVAAGVTLISTINDSVDYLSTNGNNIAFTISGTWTNNPSNAVNGFQRVDTLALNGGVINDYGQFYNYGGILAAASVTVTGTSTYNQLGNGVGLGLGTTTINVGNAGDRFVVNGAMRNTAVSTGSPTKTGNGTLLLTGTSTYTGYTTISGGTFAIGAGAVIYSGAFNATVLTVGSGATLDLQNWGYDQSTNTTSLGGLSANASSMVVNGGLIRISGTAPTSYGRGVTVNSGGATLEAAAGANWTIDTVNTSVAWVYSGNPTITLAGGGTGRFDKVLGNGTGGLVKSDTGTWTLGGVNTFTGNVSITGGTLILGGAGQLGSGTYAGTITNGGAFVISTSANQTLSGAVGGSGSLAQNGAGALTLSGSNSFAGGVSVSAGSLRIGNAAALGTGTVTLTGGALSSNGGTARTIINAVVVGGDATLGDVTNTGALTLTGGVDLGGATRQLTTPSNVTFASAVTGAGGLTKAGAGTLTLSVANTYAGATTVSAGTLALSGVGDIASSSALDVAAGAVFDIASASGDRTIGPLKGAGNVILGGNTLLTNVIGESITFDGVISGAGGFTKAGPDQLILTGSQTFTGAARVEGGTLELSNGSAFASASRIFVASGATLQTPGLTIVNSQTLGGYGTVSGDVTLEPGAIVSPGGSIGNLTVAGGVTFSGTSGYKFEITNAVTGTTPGTDWDVLTATSLTILSTSTNQYSILLTSLTSGTDQNPGSMGGNWDPSGNFQWLFVTTQNQISPFDAEAFTIDQTNFAPYNTVNGLFSVVRGDSIGKSDTDLYIVYAAVPEPGTLALAGIGLAAAGWAARHRRRRTR